MAKRTLVTPDIELGSEVVRALDASGFPLTVALWSFNEEAEEYQLVMGTPLYDKEGPTECYGRILAALSSWDPRVVHDIDMRVLGHKNPLIRGLRRTFGKTASVEGMRLGGQTIGGVYIDDAYVYRIK
jgi:hypothetical protein